MTGVARRTPSPGDVWELAVDGNGIGAMVLVLGAREDYVLAAPVTKTDQPHFPPALLMSGDFVVWPTRETGLSAALLGTYVGRPLTSGQLAALGQYDDSDQTPPLPVAAGAYDEAFSVAMIEEMAELCFWQPPTQGKAR